MAAANTGPKKFLGLPLGYWALIIVAVLFLVFAWATTATKHAPDLIATNSGDVHLAPVGLSPAGAVNTPAGPSAAVAAMTTSPASGSQATQNTGLPVAMTAPQATSPPTAPSALLASPPAGAQPPSASSVENGAVPAAMEADIQKLTGTISELQNQVAELSGTVGALTTTQLKDEQALTVATQKVATLSAELAKVREQGTQLRHAVDTREALPGWSVQAINGNEALLQGPDGATKLVHPGDQVFGVKILSVDAKTSTVNTSGGAVRGN